MRFRFVPSAGLLLAAVLVAAPAAAQTQEEVRFQGELNACGALPEAQRAACVAAVRAKIREAWIARIEAQSSRRQSN